MRIFKICIAFMLAGPAIADGVDDALVDATVVPVVRTEENMLPPMGNNLATPLARPQDAVATGRSQNGNAIEHIVVSAAILGLMYLLGDS